MLNTALDGSMPVIQDRVQNFPARPLDLRQDVAFAPPQGFVDLQFEVGGISRGEPYRTLVQVIRPVDHDQSSGVVVVEPWHPAGHWTIYSKIEQFVARSMHTAVVVVSNSQVLEKCIKPQSSTLFGDLTLPDFMGSDSEVIAQIGALIRSGELTDSDPRQMILAGQSFEGYWTRRYMEEQHPFAFFSGQHIYDGYFPAQSALGNVDGPMVDVDVPVIELQGESEVVRYFERGAKAVLHRKSDSASYRLYEVPGMAHVGTRNGANAERVAELKCHYGRWSNFPLSEVYHAALSDLVEWIDTKVAPRSVSRIETVDGGRTIVRDEHGNARGGLRTSLLEVPNRTVHATSGPYPAEEDGPRCDFFGWDEFFPPEKLKQLYSSHDHYVEEVMSCLERMIADRWLLREDANGLLAEAVNDRSFWKE